MPLTKAPKRRLKKGTDKKPLPKPDAQQTQSVSPAAQTVPPKLQQWVLDVFQDVCADVLTDNESATRTIQEVKQHLYERDFVQAFGRSEFLEAYATRWSPTRSLCYLDIMCSLHAISERLSESAGDVRPVKAGGKLSIDGKSSPSREIRPSTEMDEAGRSQRIVCLGAGGGAELVALAGFLRNVTIESSSSQSRDHLVVPLDCVFVDVADWSLVLSKLHSKAIEVPSTSPATAGHPDSPLLKALPLTSSIIQCDVLSATHDDLAATVGNATLVTLMFTLNELYSTSVGSTTKMLLSLTSMLEPGALLLVVDSPGSYSTVSLGASSHQEKASAAAPEKPANEKRYPMQWLLNHTLLETATIRDSKDKPHKQWTKLESQESQWYRLPKLEYPLELEDMRYQLHLYQRS